MITLFEEVLLNIGRIVSQSLHPTLPSVFNVVSKSGTSKDYRFIFVFRHYNASSDSVT